MVINRFSPFVKMWSLLFTWQWQNTISFCYILVAKVGRRSFSARIWCASVILKYSLRGIPGTLAVRKTPTNSWASPASQRLHLFTKVPLYTLHGNWLVDVDIWSALYAVRKYILPSISIKSSSTPCRSILWCTALLNSEIDLDLQPQILPCSPGEYEPACTSARSLQIILNSNYKRIAGSRVSSLRRSARFLDYFPGSQIICAILLVFTFSQIVYPSNYDTHRIRST